MRGIAIFGTGGFAREVHECLQDAIDAGAVDRPVLGFLDDDVSKHGQVIHGLPVLGGAQWVRDHPGIGVVIAVGSPPVKRKLALALREAGASFPTVIHPTAVVGRFVSLGEGNIVCAKCILTTDAATGAFVTFNLGVTYAHDSTIGAYSTMAPGVHLSGNFTCGEGVDIGTGAVVIQGKSIGDWSIVGAGAVVVHDVPANVTVVGAPARVIKERDAGWQEA